MFLRLQILLVSDNIRCTLFQSHQALSFNSYGGSLNVIGNRTFVAPLERLKLEYIVRGEQKHIIELIQSITASQGLKGFWKGNVVNLLRTAPFKSINFYEQF